jgi:hypothetical protein
VILFISKPSLQTRARLNSGALAPDYDQTRRGSRNLIKFPTPQREPYLIDTLCDVALHGGGQTG